MGKNKKKKNKESQNAPEAPVGAAQASTSQADVAAPVEAEPPKASPSVGSTTTGKKGRKGRGQGGDGVQGAAYAMEQMHVQQVMEPPTQQIPPPGPPQVTAEPPKSVWGRGSVPALDQGPPPGFGKEGQGPPPGFGKEGQGVQDRPPEFGRDGQGQQTSSFKAGRRGRGTQVPASGFGRARQGAQGPSSEDGGGGQGEQQSPSSGFGRGRQGAQGPSSGFGRGQGAQGPSSDVGRRGSSPLEPMTARGRSMPQVQGASQEIGRGGPAAQSPPPEIEPVASRGPSPPQDQGMRRGSRPTEPPPTQGHPGGRGDTRPTSQQATVRAPPVQQPVHSTGAGDRRVSLMIPPRKNLNSGGTKGKRIMVDTNHFALDLRNVLNKVAVHYDVALDPNVPKRLLRLAMEEFRVKYYPNRYPAFDGRKNLVASSLLPFGEETRGTVSVRDEESRRDKEFKVTIKLAARVDMSVLSQYMKSGSSLDAPQKAIQVLDIALRNASALRFVPVGRSFFTPPTGRVVDLGDGLEMWLGIFQSVNLGWRPFINVDVAHKGFPKPQNVVELIKELGQNTKDFHITRPLSMYLKEDVDKYIKGLKVDYEIPGQSNTRRTYRVNGLMDVPSKMRFKLESGQETTVEEYFLKEKKLRLQFPNFPVLHVGSKNRPNPIYLPVELCEISHGQVTIKKMNEVQTSRMIKEAATNTDDRKRKIMDALNKADLNNNNCVKEFGLSVSERFERINARILDPPSLTYNEAKPVIPIKGVWKPSKFLVGQPLSNWTVLVLDKFTREDHIRDFAEQLKKIGRDLGMTIEIPTPSKLLTFLVPPTQWQRPAEFNKSCKDLESYLNSQKGLQLVFVVIPDKGEAYAKVKQIAELTVGVLTQCIKARTISRMNYSTASNILLKVNSKLNGVNHTFTPNIKPACLRTPAMLVGADVTHPSPDQQDIPSVAAVCASHDPKGFCYNIQYRLQEARVEIIQDLQTIMRQHLFFFYKKTGYKPDRILFFRDGVSEGQFSQVLNEELQAIRNACKSIQKDGNYKPSITFMVVQKRHHTRFFPTRREDEDGRNKNVPAGTIVDTTITHPTEMDFYLVSHASIQGVSRPTKYHLLWDDSKMTEDELEELTYFLCHMFSRCTRSVSYPAPTYYAHLAAFRARAYIDGRKITDISREQKLSEIKADFVASSPMFFV